MILCWHDIENLCWPFIVFLLAEHLYFLLAWWRKFNIASILVYYWQNYMKTYWQHIENLHWPYIGIVLANRDDFLLAICRKLDIGSTLVLYWLNNVISMLAFYIYLVLALSWQFIGIVCANLGKMPIKRQHRTNDLCIYDANSIVCQHFSTQPTLTQCWLKEPCLLGSFQLIYAMVLLGNKIS